MTTPSIVDTTKRPTNREARNAIGGASSFLTQAAGVLDTIGHDDDIDTIRRELHNLYNDLAVRGESMDRLRAPMDEAAGAAWDNAEYKPAAVVADDVRLPPFPHLERQRLDALQDNQAGSIVAGNANVNANANANRA